MLVPYVSHDYVLQVILLMLERIEVILVFRLQLTSARYQSLSLASSFVSSMHVIVFKEIENHSGVEILVDQNRFLLSIIYPV